MKATESRQPDATPAVTMLAQHHGLGSFVNSLAGGWGTKKSMRGLLITAGVALVIAIAFGGLYAATRNTGLGVLACLAVLTVIAAIATLPRIATIAVIYTYLFQNGIIAVISGTVHVVPWPQVAELAIVRGGAEHASPGSVVGYLIKSTNGTVIRVKSPSNARNTEDLQPFEVQLVDLVRNAGRPVNERTLQANEN
jgi:hypothetical protein